MAEEKKIVTWSMVILFLSLAIVYSLMYMRNAEFFTQGQMQHQQKSEKISATTTTIPDGITVVDMGQTSGSSLR
ncbi:MAG: hypothetical protein LBI53_06045 [Candidatus Peribacteria bacterium]|jgi:hypothetical protein|nr:hypothetical protein [Candidatus Peribacteria bacterium]